MNLPVVNMKQTGQNITMLREQRGISVRQLQCMMGFATPQAIYKWQHGESLPTVDNLYALSRLYGTTMEDILVGNDEMSSRFVLGEILYLRFNVQINNVVLL